MDANQPTPDPPLTPSTTKTVRPDPAFRWIALFLASLALIAFDPVASYILAPAPGVTETVPDPATTPSTMLEIQARYMIALDGFLRERSGLSPEEAQDRTSQMRDMPLAPTPDQYVDIAGESQLDRLRAIPVIAELFGPEAALKEADAYAEQFGLSLDDELSTDLMLIRFALSDEPGLEPNESSRQRLIDRHGFFGELTLAQVDDDPRSDEIRQRLIDGASTLLVVIFAFASLVLGSMVLGLVAFIVLGVLFGTGKLKTSFGLNLRRTPSLEHNHIMIETAAVFLGSFFLFKLANVLIPIPENVATGMQFSLALVILWPVLRLDSIKRGAALMGWTGGKGLFREIGAGIVAYFAGLPVLAFGFLLAIILIGLFGSMPSHPVTESLGGGPGGLFDVVMIYVLACVWAPVVEEAVFRGAFYRALRVEIPGIPGVFLASLVTSFVFAAIHPQGILFVPALMGLAITFAFMREWRTSLIAPVFAHAMHNATIVTFSMILFSA